jgi:hypothetical protein
MKTSESYPGELDVPAGDIRQEPHLCCNRSGRLEWGTGECHRESLNVQGPQRVGPPWSQVGKEAEASRSRNTASAKHQRRLPGPEVAPALLDPKNLQPLVGHRPRLFVGGSEKPVAILSKG